MSFCGRSRLVPPAPGDEQRPARAGPGGDFVHGWQIVSMDIPSSETKNVLLRSSTAIQAADEDQCQIFPVKVFWSIH